MGNLNTDNKTIDEAYDALLKMGENETLTDNDIAALSKVREDNLSEDDILMRQIQNGEIELDNSDREDKQTVYVNVDPVTGRPSGIVQNIVTNSEDDFQSILDKDGDVGDVEDMELSDEAIIQSYRNNYDTPLNDSDSLLIIDAVKRFHNGETIGYKDMPSSIKSNISKTIIGNNGRDGSNDNVSVFSNIELKDQMARMFIEAIASESIELEMGNVLNDLRTSINEFTKAEIGAEYSKVSTTQRDIIETKLVEIAKGLEEEKPEDAEKLRKISKAFTQSYTLEDMYRMYRDTGKLRIKKIDIEKVTKLYSEFNYKYAKTKWTIRDISMLDPILDRHLPDYIDRVDIVKFLIVFCKYCRNFSPDNIFEHTFMYYFITNICSLDIYDKNNKEDAEFYDQLLKNIVKFIELIQTKTNKSEGSTN